MSRPTAEPERSPLIIAHRGASAHAPENTLIAFQRAVDAGADGIEFDVRLAGDGIPVVFHDPSLNRIAGRKGKVLQLTSDELRRIDAGSWFNRRYPEQADATFGNERIPTLQEALRFLERFENVLYVEMKCREADVERLARAVGDEIRDSPLFPRIIVKSFNLRAIQHVKASCRGARTAALFAPRFRNLLRKEKHILRLAEEAGADEISLHYTLATRKLVSEAARRGLDVVIWTADHARWVRRAADLGLKAIITNDPARLIAARDILRRRKSSG